MSGYYIIAYSVCITFHSPHFLFWMALIKHSKQLIKVWEILCRETAWIFWIQKCGHFLMFVLWAFYSTYPCEKQDIFGNIVLCHMLLSNPINRLTQSEYIELKPWKVNLSWSPSYMSVYNIIVEPHDQTVQTGLYKVLCCFMYCDVHSMRMCHGVKK